MRQLTRGLDSEHSVVQSRALCAISPRIEKALLSRSRNLRPNRSTYIFTTLMQDAGKHWNAVSGGTRVGDGVQLIKGHHGPRRLDWTHEENLFSQHILQKEPLIGVRRSIPIPYMVSRLIA